METEDVNPPLEQYAHSTDSDSTGMDPLKVINGSRGTGPCGTLGMYNPPLPALFD